MPEPVRIVGNGSSFIGKRLLVGITYQTEEGDFLSREQFLGIIVEAGEEGIIVERADNGKRLSLPPELQKAEPGEYRLRASGEVVVDPDYFARWTWKKKPDNEDESQHTNNTPA